MTPRPSKINKPVRLSPTSGLNLFVDCPRCFWLHYNHNVHRPRGIFPSLPSGMDLVIKSYYDRYRGSLPPELQGAVKGMLLPDIALMNKWRNWRTGLEYHDKELNATLFGALDDCLLIDGKYMPLDYKTRGSAPEPGSSERYYQVQLDSYALLLDANGYSVSRQGYLIYYFPEEVRERGQVKFNVKVVAMTAEPERAKKIFKEAIEVLSGPSPKKHRQCAYCTWGTDLIDFD